MSTLARSKKQAVSIASGLAVTFFLCGLDQFTKYLAQNRLRGSDAFLAIPGILELRYLENRGMAWGLFQGKIPFFVTFSLLFFLFVGFLFFQIPKTVRYLPLRIVGILMFSGAMGNFLDRVLRGYVIDFFSLSFIHFPVFNVADICVVCGGGYLAWLILFYYRDEDFDFLNRRKREEKEKRK